MLDIEDRFWSEILSGDPESIRRMWAALNRQEREIVKGHLERLAGDSAWKAEQSKAARKALEVVEADK